MMGKSDCYTKEKLMQQLQDMCLKPADTVMVHSSMKAMGNVEGGADTVVDALMEYFKEGLLLTPTHTWKQMFEVTGKILQQCPDCFIKCDTIPAEWYL